MKEKPLSPSDVDSMKADTIPLDGSRCSGPLGMEGGIISNQQITASSTHRALFGLQKWYPYFSRLNKKGLVNAWTAAENDRWPWIQINLQRRMRVTGLITQGAKRIGSPEYVKSYKVAYSDDGKTWRTYKVKGKDDDMIFRGNVDNNAPSANSFTPPVAAQYVRIYPQVCRRHCTLRMELLGCELTGCSEPLGMKSGHIQDYQVMASSIFRTLNMDMFTWEPGKARLDKQGKVNAWTAGHSDQSQWLQVDLRVPTKVTGIITQGAKDFGHVQFVGSYKLAYSNNGERWKVYQDEKQGKDKVFQGNFDNDTHRKNVIDPPIYARLIRILPWSWYGRITLRAENCLSFQAVKPRCRSPNGNICPEQLSSLGSGLVYRDLFFCVALGSNATGRPAASCPGAVTESMRLRSRRRGGRVSFIRREESGANELAAVSRRATWCRDALIRGVINTCTDQGERTHNLQHPSPKQRRTNVDPQRVLGGIVGDVSSRLPATPPLLTSGMIVVVYRETNGPRFERLADGAEETKRERRKERKQLELTQL
ncbi:EGF-like repeat and discoidin I-like domain-containing protein 3 [Liparis tanakae]|uniref:EGF-like repeat and discoidin I-like domain-containing protein 3 n=1 Tax=Liparis tanakae TaxID=230148 RepID=A0A4Z2I8T5_9TELE|nr:EGF-like repeat and discoidin I-like domain-containing protein 3 [Liparis tanakae]